MFSSNSEPEPIEAIVKIRRRKSVHRRNQEIIESRRVLLMRNMAELNGPISSTNVAREILERHIQEFGQSGDLKNLEERSNLAKAWSVIKWPFRIFFKLMCCCKKSSADENQRMYPMPTRYPRVIHIRNDRLREIDPVEKVGRWIDLARRHNWQMQIIN